MHQQLTPFAAVPKIVENSHILLIMRAGRFFRSGNPMRSFCLIILVLLTCSQVLALPARYLKDERDPLTVGWRLQQNQQTEQARDVFREIIKLNPENMDARGLLIYSYLNSSDPNDVAKGIRELIAALASRPDHAEFWRIAAEITGGQVFDRKTYSARYENASRLLLDIAVEFSTRPALLDRAQADAVRKLRELLVSLLTSLVDMAKKDLPYEEREKGIADPDVPIRRLAADLTRSFYLKAAELAPEEASFHKRIVSFMWRLTEEFGNDVTWAGHAREAASRAYEMAPYDPEAVMLLGRARLISALAIKVDPDDQKAADERRSLLLSSQEAYRQALVLRPHHPTAIEELAFAYGETKETEPGAAFLQAEVADAPDDAAKLHAMRCVVQLYTSAGKADQAEQALRNLLAQFPDYIEGYVKLVGLYAGMENGNEKAVAVLEDVARNQPEFINAHVWLGSFYQNSSEPEKAEKAYLAALRLLRSDAQHVKFARPDLKTSDVSARMLVVHQALMGLSTIYGNREEYIKAGEIITNYEYVYGLRQRSEGVWTSYDPPSIPAEAYLQAGTSYFLGRSRLKGIKLLENAIALKKGHFYDAQRQLANLHLTMLVLNKLPDDTLSDYMTQCREHVKAALTLWEQISRDRPGDPGAQYLVAYMGLALTERSADEVGKLESGRANECVLTQSMAIVNLLLKDQPANMSALVLRAYIHDLLGDTTKAMEDATAASQLQQNEAFTAAPPPPRPRTQSDEPLVESAEAGPLRRCSEDEFKSLRAQALNTIAWINVTTRSDLPKAEELVQQALSLAPSLPAAHDTLAWILYLKAAAEQNAEARKALLEKALAHANEAVGTIRITPRQYYHLAEITLACDQTDAGRTQAKERAAVAIEINPLLPEAIKAAELIKKLESPP